VLSILHYGMYAPGTYVYLKESTKSFHVKE